ncbi:hypothetical protein RSOLAG22IIIB_12942 [Rhizoctonia solani]|uniref:Uncharacterized protein n=1 Tax=Rhizoctonia solani TaxID=456999 RepID=A0A0K6GH91_9AGAM|nr:hypothetical protein RSOLAG22IIIB_12942 [Rhizoctonia solani]
MPHKLAPSARAYLAARDPNSKYNPKKPFMNELWGILDAYHFIRCGKRYNPTSPVPSSPANALNEPGGTISSGATSLPTSGTSAACHSQPPKGTLEESALLHKRPEETDTVSWKSLRNIGAFIGAFDKKQVHNVVLYDTRRCKPSFLAKPSQYKQFQAEGPKIYNNRPQNADGLPIGLFHSVFDSFQRRINSASFSPTPLQLSNTLPLLTVSQDLYKTEIGPNVRTEALKSLLSKLLDHHIRECSIPETKSGGVVQDSNGAYSMIVQVKNEVGTGGCDPSIQAAIAFANYWSDHQPHWLKQQCCCPSMTLSIRGPWMCVLGAIMLERPVVQSFTPFFWVGHNRSLPEHVKTVAKIFASLAESLSELDHFYRGFNMSEPQNPAKHFPYIQHFTVEGKRVKIKYKPSPAHGKPVFRATAQPEGSDHYPMIVNSEDPSEFKVAHRTMVVKKEAPYDAIGMLSPPSCVLQDVDRALGVLHEHNMVFGDLRSGVKNEQGQLVGGMLIDFDCCGTAGQATYPTDIEPMIEGVGPGLPMQLEHDKVILKRLSDPAAFERRISYDTYIRSLRKPMAKCDYYHFG